MHLEEIRFNSSKDFIKSKSNLLLYSLHYAKACNEFAAHISALLRPGNTAPFKEMLQRWRAVGNTVSDLTGLRFEPQTSHSRDERFTADFIFQRIDAFVLMPTKCASLWLRLHWSWGAVQTGLKPKTASSNKLKTDKVDDFCYNAV